MSPEAGPGGPASDDLDRQLRRAWRTSCDRLRQLEELPDPSGAARVVAERARYLDELQRRDPGGFASWLAATERRIRRTGHDADRAVPRQRRSTEG